MQRPRWWAGLDSNQRIAFASRIYSPVPLTTRPPTHDPDSRDYGTRMRGSYHDASCRTCEEFASTRPEHRVDADVP